MIFKVVKMKNFSRKLLMFFLIFAQNIGYGYTLKPPRRSDSNEYPQSMFWSKNKKNRYTPANPSFTMYKWGLRGYSLHGHVFQMFKAKTGFYMTNHLTREHSCTDLFSWHSSCQFCQIANQSSHLRAPQGFITSDITS